MNILIICDQLDHGGAGHVAALLANGLTARGHSVSLLTNTNKSINYEIDHNVYVGGFIPKGRNGIVKFVKSLALTRGHIKRNKPDVIIGILWLCSLIGWISSIGKHIPVVATEHNSFEWPRGTRMPFMQWFPKFYLNKLYDCVTVLTHADKQIIGDRLKNVFVMSNPLCYNPDNGEIPKKKIILACGRIYDWHQKGFDLIIRAWAKIHMRYKDWQVQIVGDSDSESESYLHQLCNELLVSDSVSIHGGHKELLPYYKNAEVFVLPSRNEGFGLVLIEAMSQQCACVSCNYGGRQAEIINDGVDGVLCECDNADSLAEGLIAILDDEKKRKGVQLRALDKSRQFTLEKISENWENLLKSLLDER